MPNDKKKKDPFAARLSADNLPNDNIIAQILETYKEMGGDQFRFVPHPHEDEPIISAFSLFDIKENRLVYICLNQEQIFEAINAYLFKKHYKEFCAWVKRNYGDDVNLFTLHKECDEWVEFVQTDEIAASQKSVAIIPVTFSANEITFMLRSALQAMDLDVSFATPTDTPDDLAMLDKIMDEFEEILKTAKPIMSDGNVGSADEDSGDDEEDSIDTPHIMA